jgi:hypothetical protein
MIVDIQTVLLWAILIGGIVYETTMWIYRKISMGEQFSLEKYALTYGYVGLFAVVTYYVTGVIPSVGDVMINLTEIPNVAAFLPLITALVMGIFQQGSRKISSANKPPEVISASPSAGTGGKCIIAGIYGGSAASSVPQTALSFDINQIPTLFFDLIGTETGPVALRLSIDGVILKKWVSDIISADNGVFTAKIIEIGERMPFAFHMWSNFAVPGTHIVTVSTGQFDATGKSLTWITSDNFSVALTGTKLPE